MIAHDPLHGSGHAALPHPALALGHGRQTIRWVGMANTRGWQPAVDVAVHPFPRQMMALTATPERPHPEPADGLAKGDDAGPVHGHPVVLPVPAHDRAQIAAHHRERFVPASP